jgi:hypothetical protein
MTQHPLTTRLGEYISYVLPDPHGPQQKAVSDFVLALVTVQTCCQATLARFFDNFEAASKRLARLLHNPRLETEALACAHARALIAQLPLSGPVRLSLDWTTEDTQHLLVASVRVGGRALPLYWRAYQDMELKVRMTGYEQEFVGVLFDQVLRHVARRRFILTADRWFADVDLLDLLNELGISYVIRTKSNYKVLIEEQWRKLGSVRWRGNQRRRAWGRVRYTETDLRRVFLAQARARDAKGNWGVWHLLSNRNLSAVRMSREYALRFTCEEGFRDGNRRLAFADARIACMKAWARMFPLVAVALLVVTQMGCALLQCAEREQWLRRVRSRRRARSELSLVRSLVSSCWRRAKADGRCSNKHRLNLEASL